MKRFELFTNFFRSAILITAAIVVVACSTHQSHALRQLEVGMTKAEALDIAGDPTHTGREHGQDKWEYINRTEGANETYYVFFSEGRVTYVGPSQAPPGPKNLNFRSVGE